MKNTWKLTGRIVSGAKKAAFFTQLDWVQEQCTDKLGFTPYPGTLNLEISEESVPVLEDLQKEEGIELIPPDPEFCTARILPISLGEESGAIIIPEDDVRIHDKTIVEVMAPLRLKDALNVDDGDSITINVKRS